MRRDVVRSDCEEWKGVGSVFLAVAIGLAVTAMILQIAGGFPASEAHAFWRQPLLRRVLLWPMAEAFVLAVTSAPRAPWPLLWAFIPVACAVAAFANAALAPRDGHPTASWAWLGAIVGPISTGVLWALQGHGTWWDVATRWVVGLCGGWTLTVLLLQGSVPVWRQIHVTASPVTRANTTSGWSLIQGVQGTGRAYWITVTDDAPAPVCVGTGYIAAEGPQGAVRDLGEGVLAMQNAYGQQPAYTQVRPGQTWSVPFVFYSLGAFHKTLRFDGLSVGQLTTYEMWEIMMASMRTTPLPRGWHLVVRVTQAASCRAVNVAASGPGHTYVVNP